MNRPVITTIDDFDIAIRDMLFNAHTHGELCDPEEIVYKEQDVIAIIKKTILLYSDERPDNLR